MMPVETLRSLLEASLEPGAPCASRGVQEGAVGGALCTTPPMPRALWCATRTLRARDAERPSRGLDTECPSSAWAPRAAGSGGLDAERRRR